MPTWKQTGPMCLCSLHLSHMTFSCSGTDFIRATFCMSIVDLPFRIWGNRDGQHKTCPSIISHFTLIAHWLQNTNTFRSDVFMIVHANGHLPDASVDLITVQVINKTILISRKRLVASVDVHTLAAGIIHTAMAVTPLNCGSSCLRNQPCICFCGQSEQIIKQNKCLCVCCSDTKHKAITISLKKKEKGCSWLCMTDVNWLWWRACFLNTSRASFSLI